MQSSPDYKALYQAKAAEVADLQAKVATLSHTLDELKRLIYGSKNEKFIPFTTADSAQLNLGMDMAAPEHQAVCKAQQITYSRVAKADNTTAGNHPGRMKLPDHLERREIILEPANTQGLRKIGEEVTKELEYEPGKLYVNRYVRPKYVSPDNTNILIAPMRESPLAKAIAGPGLLAQIVIDKYVDHLPLYRQQQRFARENINIPYSTITDWVTGACKLILPLYDALQKEVLRSDYLHAYGTPIKVLDKDKKGQTHRGYFWVYHISLLDLVLFDYQQGCGREGPSGMLKDFSGHLQTDGYSTYNIFGD